MKETQAAEFGFYLIHHFFGGPGNGKVMSVSYLVVLLINL